MTRTYAYTFWVELFQNLQKGNEERIMKNPAIDFGERVKAGEFDSYSDEEYEDMLSDVEQENALYDHRAYATSYVILLRALQKMEFTQEERNVIIKIFTNVAQRTDFRKGEKQ